MTRRVSSLKPLSIGLTCTALIAATACQSSGAPLAVRLNGSFSLALVNGQTLPDTEAVAPSTAPGFPSCTMLGTRGTMVLDSLAGTFNITMYVRSVCAGTEGLYLTESGTFSQDGNLLSMTETFPDRVETFTGSIDATSITVRGVFKTYTFMR